MLSKSYCWITFGLLAAMLFACEGQAMEDSPTQAASSLGDEFAIALPSEDPSIGAPTKQTTIEPATDEAGLSPTVHATPCSTGLIFSEEMTDYEAILLCYLNGSGPVDGLAEAITALTGTRHESEVQMVGQVRTSDITGDGQDEVIVYIRMEIVGLFSGEGIYVFQQGNGIYESMGPYVFGGQTRGDVDGIRAVQDLNANGFPEIVVTYIDNVGNAGANRAMAILEWDGQQFVDLRPRGDWRGQLTNLSGTVDELILEDIDGNGTFEIRNTNFNTHVRHECPWGPVRNEYVYWIWDGERYSFLRYEYPPPVYRFQAAFDGDNATINGQLDEALEFYQMAIFDQSLKPGDVSDWMDEEPSYCVGTFRAFTDPGEPQRIEAYSRFRLALTQILRGDLASAQIAYSTLQENFPSGSPGGQYAELAKEFWTAYQSSQDVERGCQAAIEFANANYADVVVPLFSSYGSTNWRFDIAELCPFPPPE